MSIFEIYELQVKNTMHPTHAIRSITYLECSEARILEAFVCKLKIIFREDGLKHIPAKKSLGLSLMEDFR
jgi:hypothetical protein